MKKASSHIATSSSTSSQEAFTQRKQATLHALYGVSPFETLDKSPKGSVDEAVVELLRIINACETPFYSTSSCAGRVAIFCETAAAEKAAVAALVNEPDINGAPTGGFWLFVSHEPFLARHLAHDSLMQLAQSKCRVLNTQNDTQKRFVFFKFEPFILHVECRTLADAQQLYGTVYALGFRNSGIAASAKGKFVVAVRSSLKLDAPIGYFLWDAAANAAVQYVPLVDAAYFEVLRQLADEKFAANQRKIDELQRALEKMLATAPAPSK